MATRKKKPKVKETFTRTVTLTFQLKSDEPISVHELMVADLAEQVSKQMVERTREHGTVTSFDEPGITGTWRFSDR